jgi:hypothetical protein
MDELERERASASYALAIATVPQSDRGLDAFELFDRHLACMEIVTIWPDMSVDENLGVLRLTREWAVYFSKYHPIWSKRLQWKQLASQTMPEGVRQLALRRIAEGIATGEWEEPRWPDIN